MLLYSIGRGHTQKKKKKNDVFKPMVRYFQSRSGGNKELTQKREF